MIATRTAMKKDERCMVCSGASRDLTMLTSLLNLLSATFPGNF